MGESYNGIRALADLFAVVKIPNTWADLLQDVGPLIPVLM